MKTMRLARLNQSISFLLVFFCLTFIPRSLLNKTKAEVGNALLRNNKENTLSTSNKVLTTINPDLRFRTAPTNLLTTTDKVVLGAQQREEQEEEEEEGWHTSILERFLYEVIAAAVEYCCNHHTRLYRYRNRPPKLMKKRMFGLSRVKWRMMDETFSKNIGIRDLFYQANPSRDISNFMEAIYSISAAAIESSVVTSINLMRYCLAISIFWIYYFFIVRKHRLIILKNSFRYRWRRMRLRFRSLRTLFMLHLRVIYFRIFFPFLICKTPQMIAICYLYMIWYYAWYCMQSLIELMPDSWKLLFFVARGVARGECSPSIAICVVIGLISGKKETKRNPRRRKKPCTCQSWKKMKLVPFLVMGCSRPVMAPQHVLETPPVSALGDILIKSIVGCVFFAWACYIYKQWPTLLEAEAHLKSIYEIYGDGCSKKRKKQKASLTRRSRWMSKYRIILFATIVLRQPVLVVAPINDGTGNPSIPVAASVVGAGVAAATSFALTADNVFNTSHRTRGQYTRWRKEENTLANRCAKFGVEYALPSPNETREEQEQRRNRLEQLCKVKQREKRQKKNSDTQKKRRDAESIPQKRKRQRQNAQQMSKTRATETEEAAALRREKDRLYRQRRKEAKDHVYDEDNTIFIGKNEKVPFIEVSHDGVNEARRFLTRTSIDLDSDTLLLRDDGDGDGGDHDHHDGQNGNNEHRHHAIGCVVCDEFIIGTEELCSITKDQLLEQKHRLGVDSYGEYHGEIDEVLQKQYEIEGLEGLLLSRRFGKDGADTFSVCKKCQKALYSAASTPPKCAIANGFAIGCIPETIDFTNEEGEKRSIKTVIDHCDGDGNATTISESKISSIMAAALSLIRPYAYIFAFHGGQHKTLLGNFQFFETSQTKFSGAINYLQQSGISSNIYVVLAGRMTPSQKEIVRRKAELDKDLYFALLHWLKAHHPNYRHITINEKVDPKIEVVADPDTDANTDKELDTDVERRYDGATFYFSSGRDPTKEASVCKTNKELVLALLEDSAAPTLTLHGGEYARFGDVKKLENVFPTAFPFGMGGPTQNRRNKISDEEKIRHYLRLSLPQFMESEFVLVANFLLGRILSYRSAMIRYIYVVETMLFENVTPFYPCGESSRSH